MLTSLSYCLRMRQFYVIVCIVCAIKIIKVTELTITPDSGSPVEKGVSNYWMMGWIW